MRQIEVDFDAHLEMLEDKDGHCGFLALEDNFRHFAAACITALIADPHLDHTLVVGEAHLHKPRDFDRKLRRLAQALEACPLPGMPKKHAIHGIAFPTPQFLELRRRYYSEEEVDE